MIAATKILTLLALPLGLSWALLILTFVLVVFHSRWALLPLGISIFLITLGGNEWLSNRFVGALEQEYVFGPGGADELPQADAIVVLGGSTLSAIPPRISVEVESQGDRVLFAADLYKRGKAPKIITTGGMVAKWNGQTFFEASDAAALLVQLGVPKEAIEEETRSMTTGQNALYVKKMIEGREYKKILLVTSALHMRRAMRMFSVLDVEVIPAPTDYSVSVTSPNSIPLYPYFLVKGIIPNAHYLSQSTFGVKEVLGRFQKPPEE